MHAPAESVPARVAQVGLRFEAACASGVLDVPLPGAGVHRRWLALARLAADDLCVARLAEAHLDALAILAELGSASPAPGTRWGVWAAHPPAPSLTAARTDGGWLLSGRKPWCSGARTLTHALVTADAADGYRLFAVELTATRPCPGTWPAVGMAGSDSLEVEFDDLLATAVGGPHDYLERPGFWHGAIAVAACWYGGAVGLARALTDGGRSLHPHALAHLGAVDARLSSLATVFAVVAAEVDADPLDRTGQAHLRAARLRAETERTALDVLDRVGRALGAGPLCRDARHAGLAADLPVYLRQSHAETDLAQLGALVLDGGTGWL